MTNQQEMFTGTAKAALESHPKKGRFKEINRHTNNATLMLRCLVNNDIEEIIKKAIEKAKSGDSTAMRLILDRAIPDRNEALIKIKFPHIKNIKDVIEANAIVLDTVASGKITPNEGKALTALIEDVRKSIEVDIEERLLLIEEKMAIEEEKEKRRNQ